MQGLIESTSLDKSLHVQAQSTAEADHVISHMTIEGQTVLDPLMGIYFSP
jgi:hypothetical protein